MALVPSKLCFSQNSVIVRLHALRNVRKGVCISSEDLLFQIRKDKIAPKVVIIPLLKSFFHPFQKFCEKVAVEIKNFVKK